MKLKLAQLALTPENLRLKLASRQVINVPVVVLTTEVIYRNLNNFQPPLFSVKSILFKVEGQPVLHFSHFLYLRKKLLNLYSISIIIILCIY